VTTSNDLPTEDQMSETFPAMPAEFLTICGLAVPDDEREGLLAALGSMHALAESLYSVAGARYIDPAFGWTPVV
jgi:hypothetical protein